ncbi:uncharacterized protein LOC143231639 isoform X2 [Tachypleus tridentatus]|uniref:uncharacterized protein LOC143231639 isoform X2 n=1 Tax=Tachypleus tridentatus TaxID=6853 RepID=UPI003FD2A1E1
MNRVQFIEENKVMKQKLDEAQEELKSKTKKGIIVERDLRTVPESEILAGLTSQGVTAVR